ncbi:MAG: hypothetical protein QG637_1743 [Chloroflexota bacterium]|nr:hypothetical protein [Chloroflexota bacterium]
MTPPDRMSPRERVEAALFGGEPDMVPFTHYDTLFPRCAVERQLRNDGLCIVQRRPSVFTVDSPNVSREEIHFPGSDGRARIRTIIRTPAGTLSSVHISAPIGDRPADQVMSWTSWREERLFKGPADYEPLEFMIQDRRYSPNYEVFQAQADLMGDDVIMRAGIAYEPLQEIIIEYMGIEQFAVEWAERRERVLHLHSVMVEDRRKIYPIVAKSPARIANYGGNVTPEIVGRDRFERLIVPCYNEAAEALHAHGKLLGCHFDANVRTLAPAIARSKLDYIEAFSPQPSSDMTLAEARAAWPDKILWINFPSAVHLEPLPAIEAMTRRLLREAAPGHRFLIGITEDVPADRWQESLSAILRVIREDGRLPIAR